MPDRSGPQVYSIAAHRGFADALVAGLIPRYSESDVGLARLTLLLPSQRAVRTVTEAFVRLSQGGMLLPRMAVVGDLDLDETLGPLLDPLLGGADIPPAADPTRRWLRLAEILREVQGAESPRGAALLRQAWEAGRTMDRLLVEGVAPDALLDPEVVGIAADQADHWRASTTVFLQVQHAWLDELATRGEIDAPARRNHLFEHAARRWKADPPSHPIVAAGVTSASPALAGLLRVVAELPKGAVILPDLDLNLDREVWDTLGTAGQPEEPGDPPFGRGDAVTHPQYHLKLLLNRMGVHRDEVQPWHRAGLSPAPPARSRAISNLFLPPAASARWVDLDEDQRRLSGVRLMESAHPGEEAQAIAVLVREALAAAERRVALVTPSRGLAARVVAHLGRWGIEADDTAGTGLSQTPAGRLLLLLAEIAAEDAAPVPLIALLGHPLVRQGEARPAWLDNVRVLDRAIRGPRPGPGLAALRPKAEKIDAGWWREVEDILGPLLAAAENTGLADWLDLLAAAAERLCGEAVWGNADGRALAAFVEDLREAAREVGSALPTRDLPAALGDAMDRVSVRPPWGGHPRVQIYGLLEARMSRADLVICGALHEGSWPASPGTDALLPPAVLRRLGVPGGDFRIGLSAHDLAAALGAPEVVLSWARRDEAGPVIPSRFVLRVEAMLGKLAEGHRELEAVRLARALNEPEPAEPAPRPAPDPSPEQRLVAISATALDRLLGDPYQFYAQAILQLRALDGLDAAPSAAWRGTAVHEILDRWHKAGDRAGELIPLALEVLTEMSAHPLMRSLWQPRLVAALAWIEAEVARQRREESRTVLDTEAEGQVKIDGVTLHGRADRIDRIGGRGLGIVDYKTGSPPSARMVEKGYALQLGLLGLIAEAGGFEQAKGDPVAYEYWSLAKDGDAFGYIKTPLRLEGKRSGILPDEFLPEARRLLTEAIGKWIKGREPFTARLNPDYPGYADYDQLMRLDEWQGRIGDVL